MVLFPKVGVAYWIVTDFWETFCAVPVTLIRKGGLFDYGNGAKGLYIAHWNVTDEYTEEYDVSRRELFRTQRAAWRLAQKLNREAGRE